MADLKYLTITDLSGGRNGWEGSPLSIPDDQCAEALNVDFWDSPCGTRRQGATAVSISFSGGGGPFAGSIGALLRHVPGDDETAAELWAIDGNATGRFARMAGATTFAEVTLKDNMSAASDAFNVNGASLNGFLWLAYKSAGSVNRLHVWDPSLSKVRRVGIATPNAPTSAEDGGGGLSFTRFYRVRDVDVSGSDVRRRSEASSVISRTIAAKAGITVTKGAATSEDETHWELEAADSASGPWYRIARTVIGTTTFDDTNATIPTTNPSPVDGINNPPPSAKFVIATDARLVMANSFETSGGFVTPKNNRIWFTPVIGDNDVGDLERIPTGRYLDVDAAVTGLATAGGGVIYVFSYRKIWKLVPTGDPTAPYAKYTFATSVGCIRHHSITTADDEFGRPAVYFLSTRGPYRIGDSGLQFCGADVVDLMGSLTGGHSLWYADKHQVWMWYANSQTYSAGKIVFDVRRGRVGPNGDIRGGWVSHTGNSGAAYASVMFSNTLAASMSKDLKPYIAQQATGTLWKCDDTGVYADDGTSYQAYIDTKEYTPMGLTGHFQIFNGTITFSARRNNQSLTVTAEQDLTLSGAGGPTGVTATVSWGVINSTPQHGQLVGLELAQMKSVAFRIGDLSGASTNDFIIYGLSIPYFPQERR